MLIIGKSMDLSVKTSLIGDRTETHPTLALATSKTPTPQNHTQTIPTQTQPHTKTARLLFRLQINPLPKLTVEMPYLDIVHKIIILRGKHHSKNPPRNREGVGGMGVENAKSRVCWGGVRGAGVAGCTP